MYFTHPQFNKIFFPKANGLKNKLAKFFPNKYIVFTDSGRSAFQLAVKSLNLENTEMIVPAYICDIFQPIFDDLNIKPNYVDISLDDFNMDLKEENITENTKSILVCHTYGYPNDMEKIQKLADKYNLKIIEDCARSFGIKFKDQYLGNFSDCSIFSLPKFIPTTNTGMLISKKPIKAELNKNKIKIKTIIKFIRLFPALAIITEKFRINNIKTNKLTHPKKPSKQSLKIFNWYLKDFEKTIEKRKQLAEYFKKELEKLNIKACKGITYISALMENRDKIFNELRKKNIYCSKTWHNPINIEKPNSKKASEQIINFPLQDYYEKKDIDKIIKELQSILN